MDYSIHYTMRADGPDGEMIEATVPEQPFFFSDGDPEVLPALLDAVRNGVVGEPFTLLIPCAEAYGPELDDAYVVLPKAQFIDDEGLDDDALKEDEVVVMRDDTGAEIHGVVVDVIGDRVEVDFNHPLCGMDLHFEVNIMSA